jgi:3,5-epimerase/4-reductase
VFSSLGERQDGLVALWLISSRKSIVRFFSSCAKAFFHPSSQMYSNIILTFSFLIAEIEVFLAESSVENREDVSKELDEVKPSHVLMSAGITGRPNIDWCEDHKPETLRTNVIGTLNVADLCFMRNIHCTIYATGCIFKYDDAHPLGSGIGFTETDLPNFAESFYSETKGYMEQMLKCYPNCLILRVRMPISDDLIHRNFVTKIVKYERVVNIPNSMTVLTEMLPASLAMANKGLTGVYNFTNPGVISHNEVLDLYKKYIDPTYTYKNFTVEEQAKVIKAGRSNNELDTTKLMSDMPEGVVINDIKTAVELCFQRMEKNLEKMGWLPDNLPAEFRRS